MKENNLLKRLFLIKKKDLFELNKNCLIQTKYV